MGNFMIPVCCVCGKAAPRWHDPEWEADGGLQDFCPEHAREFGPFTAFMVPHFMSETPLTDAIADKPFASKTQLAELARKLERETAKLRERLKDVRELAEANQHRPGDLADYVLKICNR